MYIRMCVCTGRHTCECVRVEDICMQQVMIMVCVCVCEHEFMMLTLQCCCGVMQHAADTYSTYQHISPRTASLVECMNGHWMHHRYACAPVIRGHYMCRS